MSFSKQVDSNERSPNVRSFSPYEHNFVANSAFSKSPLRLFPIELYPGDLSKAKYENHISE